MLPFGLVATATASPRYSPAGSLRKFGTEVKGISGTPVIVAFCWADAEPARSRTAAYVENRCRVMDGSLYQGSRPFNRKSASTPVFLCVLCARQAAARLPPVERRLGLCVHREVQSSRSGESLNLPWQPSSLGVCQIADGRGELTHLGLIPG